MVETFTFDDVLIQPSIYSTVKSRSQVELAQTLQGRSFDLPILSASMSALDTVDGKEPDVKFAEAIKEAGGTHIFSRAIPFADRLHVAQWTGNGIAVSLQEFEEFRDVLEEANVMVSIDIANGAILPVAIHWFEEQPLIVGNFGNPEAITRNFFGSIMVKFGIGPSAVCSTREKTGVGAPQGWLVHEASNVRFREWGEGNRNSGALTIVSDGGTKTPSDFVKALALGADLVMIGTMFAAAEETPWQPEKIDGQWYKPVRGMASSEEKGNNVHVEGVSGYVPYHGKSTKDIVQELTDGLRSAMTYTDSRDLHEFKANVDILRVTPTTVMENRTRLF